MLLLPLRKAKAKQTAWKQANNTNPTPTASRTDTSLIKDTRHSGEDPIPMGEIIEDDSVGSPKVDPCDPFPLGKIGPAKPKKKITPRKRPKRVRKRGEKGGKGESKLLQRSDQTRLKADAYEVERKEHLPCVEDDT